MIVIPLGAGSSPALLAALSDGGSLWFPNLLEPDVWYGLPLVVGGASLVNTELNGLIRGSRATETVGEPSILVTALRGASMAMVWVASSVPAAMSLFWATSAMYSVGQNVLLMYPSARARLGIPRTPSDSDTPIADLLRTARLAGRRFYERASQAGDSGSEGPGSKGAP